MTFDIWVWVLFGIRTTLCVLTAKSLSLDNDRNRHKECQVLKKNQTIGYYMQDGTLLETKIDICKKMMKKRKKSYGMMSNKKKVHKVFIELNEYQVAAQAISYFLIKIFL